MKLRLALAGSYIPEFYKKKKLRELCNSTARAFERDSPDLNGLTINESISKFAIFTRECAEDAMRLGKGVDVKLRLFDSARRLGEELREEFGVREMAEVMKLGRIVYSILGIDFEGMADGTVLIRECSFSRYYPASVCGIISSLDDGLLAGLSGGGRLEFSRRITEGSEQCEACLSLKPVSR